jgi:inner membrane protein
MGRRTAVWKAALWGGVCGTLPDLDALIDHGDPVRNMTLHRGWTHALFWQTTATPLVAAAVAWVDARRAHGGGRTTVPEGAAPWATRWREWLPAVWLILVTHALLDAMTVYGTRLGLPFTDTPFGVGSMFIIDPLYTLPLLVGLGVALAGRSPVSSAGRRWNLAGLALSTAYLGWSAVAQAQVEGFVTRQIAAAPGGSSEVRRVLVTPTAFNTVLWRVVVMRDHGYDEGFRSLLDGDRPVRFTHHPTDATLTRQALGVDAAASIADFSRGFFRVDEREGRVRITDLRMGQEPYYVFAFEVAQRASELRAVTPPRQVGGRQDIDVPASLRWLWNRALGAEVDPPR